MNAKVHANDDNVRDKQSEEWLVWTELPNAEKGKLHRLGDKNDGVHASAWGVGCSGT